MMERLRTSIRAPSSLRSSRGTGRRAGTLRTRAAWPHPANPRSLLAILKARRAGASVSLNNVTLTDTAIEANCLVGHHVVIKGSRLGRYTGIAPYCWIWGTELGPFCGVATFAHVGAAPHDPDRAASHDWARWDRYGLYHGPQDPSVRIITGADVWIGAGANVRSGVRIGHGAIVGAGAVVTKDVGDYEIVGGVPAQRLRMRFSEDVIARMLEIRWWDWPPQLLQRQVDLFRRPLTAEVLENLEDVAATVRGSSRLGSTASQR